MADRKIKIFNILESQIPEFVREDSPLFKEFLEQYYISQEHEYGTVDLADRIGDLKNITSFKKLSYAAVSITTTQAVYTTTDEILVNTTAGFPDRYGLFKIGNEIVTYTGKTATSFTGCVRGFSGIDKIEGELNPEYLNFTSTRSGTYPPKTPIQNLGIVFLAEFYRKYKTLFLPGFEERNFVGVNIDNILSRARDFYSSKGTDSSLKILFDVLFAKHIDVLKPFDNTILSSAADWDVPDVIVVEQLSGDVTKLVSTQVLQGSTSYPTAKGSVTRVKSIVVNGKKYYKLSFSSGTVQDPIKVSKRTKVLGIGNTISTLTVDSTIGFPESGSFYNLNTANQYVEVTYTSKSANQFFGCVGLSTVLTENSPIIDNNFLYGYEDSDLTKRVQMRVVGSISGFAKNVDTTNQQSTNDSLSVKHLGEKISSEDIRFNKWFLNNVAYLTVSTVNSSTSVTTVEKHYLYTGDRVDIVNRDSEVVEESNIEVTIDPSNPRQISLNSGSLVTDGSKQYYVKKRLSYAHSNLLEGDVLGNIQNTFTDADKNTYVAFSGYPGYDDVTIVDRSKTFTTAGINSTTETINIVNHNFLHGEKVYYEVTSGTKKDDRGIGVPDGIYFIDVIDSDNIRLAINIQSLESKLFSDFVDLADNTDEHKITPASLHGNSLVNQNNFKRIYKTPKTSLAQRNIAGPIGVALNGVEFYSPVSGDAYYYGQIDGITIQKNGQGYDVVNPPQVSIADTVGRDAVAIGQFTGKVEDILLTNAGFNYAETPVVTITGGNGTEAQAEARMRGFTHSISFTDLSNVKLVTDRIEFAEDHQFLDGEEITYVAGGLPIGVGSTNVGFNTSRLTSGAVYYVAKQSDKEISLATTRARALAKQNLIDFNAFGNSGHTLRSRLIRKIIDKIIVTNSTDDFSSRRIDVDGVAWPPVNEKDIFSSFVGVNTENNYIYARNHMFKNGDNVEYTFDGTAINGLQTGVNYKVTVVDEDRFKLSDAGTPTNISSVDYERKIYKDLSSVGVGTHTFKYPDITVTIDGLIAIGNTTVTPSYYNAVATPVVRGGLESVFIRNGGLGYGSTSILNYEKPPRVKVLTGESANIGLNITDGKITSAFVIDPGKEYTTPPSLNVIDATGKGSRAKLVANISNGEITSVDVMDGGVDYDPSSLVQVVPTGEQALLRANLHMWNINNVERYKTELGIEKNRDMVQIRSDLSENENKLVSFYPGQFYRHILDDNLNKTSGDYEELKTKHSPILGWAYDGNPIYGPIGHVNAFGVAGGTKRLVSGYELDVVGSNGAPDVNLRPPEKDTGFFTQDFVYKGNGDLDRSNGRFCKTPEFPNGTYAYFAAKEVTQVGPPLKTKLAFPYITHRHHHQTDEFNYDLEVSQNNKYLNSGDYKRNVTPLATYPFFDDILSSETRIDITDIKADVIESINVTEGGRNYKVGEQINLSDDTVDAEIGKIRGREILSIDTTETEFEDVIFSIDDRTVTGFTTVPHGFLDGDTIEITGISSSLYKNIEGFRPVGVTTTNTTVSVAIGTTIATTLSTFIRFSEVTSTRKFKRGEVITIGNEKLLIAAVDDVNNRYKVTRNYDNTNGTNYAVGTLVVKNPTKFEFTIPKKMENVNIDVGYEQNFSSAAVGLGSTATARVVGTAGDKNVTVTIPAKAIYLPGHQFKTGDALSITSIGGTISASQKADLSGRFRLDDVDLFAIRVGTDYLGIATSKAFVGINSSVFFTTLETDGTDHTFKQIKTNLTGIAKKVSSRVTLTTSHTLRVNDIVSFDITSDRDDDIKFKYNNILKKLVVNPHTFVGTAVSTTTNEITIPNHGLETGDIVAYTNAVGVATPLQNNRQYYVIKITEDRIKLADNEYSATVFPYENINLTEQGNGTHEIASVNPRLEVTNGSTVSIATSDASLTGYDIQFYNDNEFKSRYTSKLITRSGTIGNGDPSTKIELNVSTDLPKNLYYRIEGIDSKYTDTYPSSVNTDVPSYSNIAVINSKYNNTEHRITSVGSTTFDFTLVGAAETTSYDSTGFSSAFYFTDSIHETGPIHSVKIVNPGTNLKTLPVITSIDTVNGEFGKLQVESSEIGQILDNVVVEQGVEFVEDRTLTPKVNSNIILSLTNTLALDSVGITSGGKNYINPPQVTAVGNNTIKINASVQGSSVTDVQVITGDSNLTDDLRLFATTNTNGVKVTNATSNSQVNTLSIKGPVAGFGPNFPFKVGDKIFVENIQITDPSTSDGYNSSDYDYQYFTVSQIGIVTGGEFIRYSIAGLGVTGGTYDSSVSNNFGRVIKVEDVAKFKPTFKTVEFFENEKISLINDPNVFGFVAKNGWNSTLKTLKLKNVNGTFTKDAIIRGGVGNLKATVDNVSEYDFDFTVDGLVTNRGDWSSQIGKLNYDLQRIHDSDYYQRFSYSIRGQIAYDEWKESVNSLDHTAGFKNFSDYEIFNVPPIPVGIGSTLSASVDLNIELASEASVWTRLFYDFASEDTEQRNLSRIIKFKHSVITDYNESRTNLVLPIDDLSPQFTGFTTSVGGGIIGLSTFPILYQGDPLLYGTIDPSTAIDLTGNDTRGIITLVDHRFNTGEAIKYSPTNKDQNTGSFIGIDTTSSAGIGIANTDKLPTNLFAIRKDKDTFQVAIGLTEAVAGTAVTFLSTGITGVGHTHSFYSDPELATTRAMITIDNVLQSPIGRKDVNVGLATAVGIGSTQISVDDMRNIQGKSILQIDDEIMKVTLTAIGATNRLNVLRGQLGTVAAAHTVGAGLTILSGDYRIDHGNLHFTDPPYGPSGIHSTTSTFSGRIFYKLNYASNAVFDDISEDFDGSKTEFAIKKNNVLLTGINTSYGAVLVNNIFQKPFLGEIGSILESDYRVVGTGRTIEFTGTTVEDIPKGGMINEFSVGVGSNYQDPRRALASVTVSGGGAINAVAITTAGQGYLRNPRVSIADTLGNGVGAALTARVFAGIVTEFAITSGGSGYSQANPPIITIDAPAPYKSLDLIGGHGSGAKMDVVVGTGGSIISYNLANPGIGYSVGDVLELSGLPFNPVGVGSTNMLVTVRNKFQHKFAGWTFGQLLELDDFSNQFNGVKKSFLLTRTITETEYYSVVAKPGTEIKLQHNLLIFLNDVLQVADKDYKFSGGTRLTFTEAPKAGSNFRIYLYTGSTDDFIEVDVDETIKPGDRLRLQYWDNVPPQTQRVIYELIASDTVETETYSGVGIVTDTSFERPVEWTKQTSDIIVDGAVISKERNYLEPQYYPSTNIIHPFTETDTSIFVEDVWSFSKVDDLGQTLNDIRVVGLGTTAVSEEFESVTYRGDYGLITGIKTDTSGINTTSPMIEFDFTVDPAIFDATPNNRQISKPGISTGEYFVVRNTTIGSGVTGIGSHVSEVVGVSTAFVNCVYKAAQVVIIPGTNDHKVRVSANVLSLSGINTSIHSTNDSKYGTFSWGVINTGARNVSTAKTFASETMNGVVGLETSTHVSRILQLRVAY